MGGVAGTKEWSPQAALPESPTPASLEVVYIGAPVALHTPGRLWSGFLGHLLARGVDPGLPECE